MGDTPITKKEPWGSAVPMSGRQADGSWPVPEVPANQSLSDQDGNPPPAPPTQSSPLSQPAPSPVTQSPQPDPREPAGEDIFADLPVKKSYLQDLYEKAKLEDPDHAAKVIDIARRLQQPESYVDKNLPEAEKTANQALYDSSFFNELEKEYPGTSEYLSDPKNMAPARDDLENLAQHEKLVRSATEAHGILENLAAHYQQSVAGLAHKRGLPVFSLLDLAMMAKPLSPTANPTLPESLAGQAGALAGDAVPMGVGGAIGAVAGTPAGPIGQAATSGAAAMALPEAMKQVLAEGGFKNTSDFWTRVFKQAAVGGVTGAAGGLFRTMLGPVAAKMALGGTASKLAGKALETAAPLAGEAGVMTTAGGVAENREVPAFSPLALLYDALVANKKVKPVDSREYLENLMVVGAMHAAHAGAEPLFDLIRGQKTDDGRALYKAMGDTAEASKLRERLPDAHREFIEELTKDGPVESIYIPEKKFTEFFQSKGLDPDQVADGLGVTDSLDEARKTGNYIKIPYATWLSKFVDNGFYRELEGDVKFDPHPSAKTPNEQEELRAELKAQYDELEKARAEGASPAAAQTIEAEKAREESADRVYQDRYQKFIEAGRTKEEAKANAELHRAILTRFSRETGLSPEELLQRFPLIVERMNEYTPKGGELFQGQNLPAPAAGVSPLGFYSPLEREVVKMDFKSVPAKDLLSRIKNIQGIKQEELDTMGLPEWLKMKGEAGEKVTKDEVLDFIRQKGVKVEQTVLAKDFSGAGDGTGIGDLAWEDPERDEPTSDDYDNEYHYYRKEDEDGIEMKTKELDEELRPEYTDADGNVDEAGLKRAIEQGLDSYAEKMAEESVNSEDYSSARFTVRESTTGWTLHGSDEYGWYNPETRESFETSLEEAKVQLAAKMIEKGEIGGDTRDLIRPEDIKWRDPIGEKPGYETIDRKARALFKAERERFLKEAEREYGEYYKDYTPEKRAKELEDDARRLAKNEIENSYNDTSNPRNKVSSRIDHPVLSGRIEGNDKKGYTLTVATEPKVGRSGSTGVVDYPLQAKSIEEAQREAVKVLEEKGHTAKSREPGTVDVNEPSGKSSWHQYALPGGSNYREFLLTLPGNEFKSGHWSQRGVLAHVRVTDRVDGEGRKTLFIEEMQSDLHQQGREKGYKGELPAGYTEHTAKEGQFVDPDDGEPIKAGSTVITDKDGKVFAHSLDREAALETISSGTVPNAPYKNTDAWAGLAMKRMIRLAAEQGYDAIAWSPAEVQVERWGTESVGWKKTPDGKGWLVGSVEQRGGRAGGVDIEEEARRRGKLLEKNGERVETRDELKKVLSDTLGRARDDRSLDALTDSIWKQMEAGQEGVKEPRKEGMEFFYDNLLPKKVVPTILKKLDKSAKVEVGTIKYDAGKDDDVKQQIWEVPLTSELKQKAMEGLPLFQQREGEGPRGAIRFEAMPDGIKRAFKSIVTLFNSADRSTIPHESAHYFFEMMGALAQDPETSDAFKKDYETLLKYVGVSSKEELQASHHEKIAEAFETYLATGRAPSTGLARVFERIKGWFLGIYGDLKKRGVEIPKEVSDVFDRWLATEEEIAHAQGAIGIRTEPIEGVPPEALTRLDDLRRQARAQAEAHLMREMTGELSEKRDAFLKAERERLTEKATAEVKELPLYKAQAELTRYLGKDAVGEAHRFLENRVTDDTAAAFEEMAEREGFGSGEDLAKKLVESDAQNGFQAEVRSRVEAGMKEHAPMMESDAISVEALKLIHNEKTAELLALETEILSGLVGHTVTRTEAAARSRAEAQAMARAAREEAKERIARKPVKEATNAQVYMTAERNAALRAEKALAKGDHEAAAKAKQEQLLNHALATEAVKAKEEATRAIEFLKGAEVKTAEKMPKGFQRQVNEMLSKFGFIAPSEEDLPILTDIAKRMAEEGSDTNEVANTTGLILDEESGKWRFETLPEFVERVNNSYYGLVLPDAALHPGKPFRELKLSELLGVEEATRSLIKVGKNYNRFLSAFEKADLVTAAKELRASVEENVGTPYAEKMRLGEPDETKAEKILGFFAELPSAIGRWLDTMLTTCDKLDGLKQDGPAKKYIYRPIEAAENTRLERTRAEMVKLDAIFGKHFKEGELEGYKNTFVDVADRKVSKEKLLSMLLNWGNEGNRDRVTRGEGLPPEAIEKLLFENLSKRDFDFAQDVWNYLDTFKPEIKKLDLDTKGVETPWVERSPLMTPHGRYEGGYYPIAYDHERSASAFLNTEQATELFKTYSGGPAQTEQGHTMARVSTLKRPIRYDMKVLTDHVEDVVHDLSYRRAVIDIARFLTQKDTKAALVNSLGIRGYKAIGDWLKAVASSPSEPLGFGESAARWLRFRTTFYYMGYRIASIPKIAMENLVNVSSELGVSDAARALKNYYFGNSGTHELVVSKSEFMRQRAEHLDRDMGDIYDKWSGKEEGAFYKFAFWTHAFIDQATSFPLWAEMYRRSLAAGSDEKLAAEHADEAVKKTFMAGGTTNQPAIMRGSEKQKALTVALGYQNMMWNRYSRQLFQIKQALRAGETMDAAFIAARSHFYTFLMPAVIGVLTEALTKNALHPNPQDEKKQMASHAIAEASPTKFIPIARDLFPYFLSKAFGEHGRDLQVTPLERAAQSLLDTAGESFAALGGHPTSEKYPEHAANAISLMVPIPKQLDDIIFNFIDWQKDHGEATWKDAIRRRTKH